MKKIYKIFIGIALVMIAYTIGLYMLQEKLIYEPDDYYVSPQEVNLPEFTENILQMKDGTKVMTWLAMGQEDKPAILFFHGNCKQLAEFAPHLLPLIENGYTVLMVEYRGFGGAEGKLNQQNMYSDAAEAYDWLKKKWSGKIVAYGYSLGTAAASGLVSERNVDGVILIAPFYSLRKLASEKNIPFAKWVLKDGYESAEKLKNANVPILIIHGGQDPLIPYHHSLWLMEDIGSKDKTLRLLPFDTHRSLFYEEHSMPYVLEWLKKI